MSILEPDVTPLPCLLRDGAKCNRGGPLWKSFLEFHVENPWVYSRLRELCFTLRKRGFARYSTRTLISVLRFEWDLKTGGQDIYVAGDPEPRSVKLNDHHSPYYARMIIEDHTDFWDFFELRRAEGDPTDLPKFIESSEVQLAFF